MKLAIIGAGPMGTAAVHALARDPDVDSVVLVDRDCDRLAAVRERLGDGPDLDTIVGDADNPDVRAALVAVDALGTASSWVDALGVTRFALRHGLPVTGIGRPPADPRTLLADFANLPGRSAILGTGLEPGLTEILAARLLGRGGSSYDHLRLFCGGVPRAPRAPLRHLSWFGPARLPVQRPTYTVAGGERRTVRRFSDVADVAVPGIGTLEAFHDGMLGWLMCDPVFGRLTTIEQKTLRWPGFARIVTGLESLGLLSDETREVPGARVAPRDLVDAVLADSMRPLPGDRDVTVLAAEVRSPSGDVRGSHIVAETDPSIGFTGMARLTGALLAESIRLLADAPPDGIVHPWEAFAGAAADLLVDRLRVHGLTVVDDARPWLRPA